MFLSNADYKVKYEIIIFCTHTNLQPPRNSNFFFIDGAEIFMDFLFFHDLESFSEGRGENSKLWE